MDHHEVYDLSMAFSQKIWDLVVPWSFFAKDTVGKQIVRSSDSISANLKEGLGRYYYRDRNLFYLYARGSLFETHCWLEKSYARKLITQLDFEDLIKKYHILEIEINRIIRNTRNQINNLPH